MTVPRAHAPLSGWPKLRDALESGGVTDEKVLEAMSRVPRDAFMEAGFEALAWENLAAPIGMDQTISQPLMVALMTQALDVAPTDKVLEIGTGSGFQCAVLSRLARRVFTIERFENLQKAAKIRFEALRFRNIVCQVGNGWRGWPQQAPFNKIIITAAAAEIPKVLCSQLAEGGYMVVPVGAVDETQNVLRITRRGSTMLTEQLTPAKFVPMVDEGPVTA